MLSSELENPSSPIRKFLDARLPLASSIQDQVKASMSRQATIRPREGAGRPPYSHIGTTISYRLAFALGNPSVGLPFVGADMANNFHGADHRSLFASLVEHLNRVRSELISSESDGELSRICWALSLYETIGRIGTAIESPLWTLGMKASLEDLLALAEPDWLDDVQALNAAARPALVEPFADVPTDRRRFGPVFKGSADVGGADADFLIGTCLIEAKATVQEGCDKQWVLQLASYALLDYDDEFGIDEVALYMVRQGILIRWPFRDFLRRMRPVDRSRGLSKPNVDVMAMRADLRNWLGKS